MRATRRLRGLAAAAVVACAGCRLEEVTLAPPEDILVAEVVLQAGASQQLALLHRTLGSGRLTAPGALVELTVPGGGVVAFSPVPARTCVDSSATFVPDTSSTCYATPPALNTSVVPGGTYSLRVRMPDGRELAGSTTVPGAFRMLRPPPLARCWLRPGVLLPMSWTRSAGAWVYLAETRMTHVRRAVNPSAPNDNPLTVTGLSITAEDTTIVFPSEFGLFDRFDEGDAAVLLALQQGLPAGVTASVTVAAVDRNYTQWVRRGSFNPSGQVQIPSLQGDGTGVFGSLVPLRFEITGANSSTLPSCGP